MKSRRMALILGAIQFLLILAITHAEPAAVQWAIDTSASGTPVSPNLYGIFYEDINYAGDGGLYAEMLQNRSFEFRRGTESWTLIKSDAKAKLKSMRTDGLNDANTKYLRISAEGSGATLTNNGYGGLVLKAGSDYHVGLWLRSLDQSVNSVIVSLHGSDGSLLASVNWTGVGTEWKSFSGVLNPTQDADAGWLGIELTSAGQLDLDSATLFPPTFHNRPNGLRVDLAQMVADLTPRFMRFPGGCVVEGSTIRTAYRWKDTIGPIEQRRSNDNLWGYYQTYGLGFLEFFEYCEDIGAEPLPVVNAGMACQARNGNLVALQDLGDWIQDAVDLIDYANAGADNPWGAKRISEGHPAPFGLKYLAVGNENWTQDYFDRYKAFAQVLKKQHPEIKLIFAAGPLANGPIFDAAWAQVKNFPVDLVDEHYYMTPEWFLANTDRYDHYSRKGPKVFLGEYAAQTPDRRNNLYAALSEAAYMTGLERNGDVVELASYAPLMAKEGSTQWEPDMIRFNNAQVFGTPSYYVQKLFSHSLSATTLPSTIKKPDAVPVDVSIEGGVGVGTWATQVQFKDLKVTDRTGKVVFQPQLTDVDNEGEVAKGDWEAKAGVLSQTSPDTECKVTFPGSWKGGAFSLKAKKTGGAEGMLILFGVQGGDYYWWNLGGWGNTQSAIEKGSGATRSIYGDPAPAKIESGRWNDIRIELQDGRIRCYLNGKKIHDLAAPGVPETFFVHAGRSSDGKLILKAVNVSNAPVSVATALKDFVGTSTKAVKQVLTSESLTDENSFKSPTKVVPETSTVEIPGNQFTWTLSPRSVTILTIPPKQ